LRKGEIVILDNVAFHKSPRAVQGIREQGAWILFLPPCSPNLNPIEMAFSKIKAHLAKDDARTYDALWKSPGQI